MIIALARIVSLWLRRRGVKVPVIPTLRRRQTLLEQFLSPPPPDGDPGPTHTQSHLPTTDTTGRMR